MHKHFSRFQRSLANVTKSVRVRFRAYTQFNPLNSGKHITSTREHYCWCWGFKELPIHLFLLKNRRNHCNMLHTRVVYLRFAILCLLIATAPDFTVGLRDVSVTVPTAVRRGDNALLICNYDMEGDTLYSVKWYKGRREFYRYTPKENPAMKTFSAPGINVERSLSNQSHVVLSSVQLSISGKFSCEVSADAPSFHTVIVSGELEVVEIPEQKPYVTGIHARYRLGDVINGNCSSMYSKPAANLSWIINEIAAPANFVKVYNVVKNRDDNLESSVVELNFIITPQHFIRGRLKLKCIAKIHEIYEQEVEKIVEEDRPRILASGRSPDANLFPFDQQGEGELTNQNELYLTHYRADMASSGSSSSIIRVRRTRTTAGTITASVNTFDVIFYGTLILSIALSINSGSWILQSDCKNNSKGTRRLRPNNCLISTPVAWHQQQEQTQNQKLLALSIFSATSSHNTTSKFEFSNS